MKKEHLSLRLSIELLSHIDAQAELSNLSRSEVINKVLEKYFLKKDISFEFHGFDHGIPILKKHKESDFKLNGYCLSEEEKTSLDRLSKNEIPIFIISLRESPAIMIWLNRACELFFKDTKYCLEELTSLNSLKPLFFHKLANSNFTVEDYQLFSSDGFPFNSTMYSIPLLSCENLKLCVVNNNLDKKGNKGENAKFWFTRLIEDFPMPCFLVQKEKFIWCNKFSQKLLKYNQSELNEKYVREVFEFESIGRQFCDNVFNQYDLNNYEMIARWCSKENDVLDVKLTCFPYEIFGLGYKVVFASEIK